MARVAWRGNLAIEAEGEDPGNDNGRQRYFSMFQLLGTYQKT